MLTATVSRYTIGTNGRPNYAVLTDVAEGRIQSPDASAREQSAEDSRVAGTDRPRSPDPESESARRRSDSSLAPDRSETSLDEIAQEKLASEEFTLEQKDESLVGGAKERAKSQGRDPAIDPRLQQDRTSEDE